MRRRPTIHEQVWPKDSSFDAVQSWPADFGVQVLSRVWIAYDRLVEEVLRHVRDWANIEHIERSLTDLHFDKIVELQTGEEPYTPTREVPVFESRVSSQAMPPTNDFGFKIRGGDLGLVWPLEAKVLADIGHVNAYLADLNDKYLACRSSPYSGEAGLVGYLLLVDGETVFDQMAENLGQTPTACLAFASRMHRVTEHVRCVPQGKRYPAKFRCHHLLMLLPNLSDGAPPSFGD